jgi:hypothetical protein
MALGVLAFGLRCLERLRAHTWGWDDLFIAAVTAILMPMGVLTIPRTFSRYVAGLVAQARDPSPRAVCFRGWRQGGMQDEKISDCS